MGSPDRPVAKISPIGRLGPQPVPRTAPLARQPPRLLDRVRTVLRTRHYSRRAESAYMGWIRSFILFHGKRHPDEMGTAGAGAFLSHLATALGTSTST
jgi:hypothetical protein